MIMKTAYVLALVISAASVSQAATPKSSGCFLASARQGYENGKAEAVDFSVLTKENQSKSQAPSLVSVTISKIDSPKCAWGAVRVEGKKDSSKGAGALFAAEFCLRGGDPLVGVPTSEEALKEVVAPSVLQPSFSSDLSLVACYDSVPVAKGKCDTGIPADDATEFRVWEIQAWSPLNTSQSETGTMSVARECPPEG